MKMVARSLCLAVLLAAVFGATSARAAHVYAGVDLRDGKDVSLLREDAAKKATVLVFISSKCPCSMSHVGELKALAGEYPEFRFIGVNSNSDESVESARAYFSAQTLPFPVIKDDKGSLADEFKALKTPHAFILTADGKRLFQGGVSNSSNFGRADRKYLREALEDLKKASPEALTNGTAAVRTPLARALGCAIPHGD